MTQPLTIWSATTEGEDCPLHTTVHWTQAEAEARVRNDLSEDCPPRLRSSLAALAGDDLMFAWNNRNGGACLIEAHEMAAPEHHDIITQRQVELAAQSIMESMFAPYELPLGDALAGKYRETARNALLAEAAHD